MIAVKIKRSKALSGIILLMLACIVYCFVQNNWIEVDYVKIRLNNLPSELIGVKIAHVSDVHLQRQAQENLRCLSRRMNCAFNF
ncbi:MAG: hypothetical protein COA82_11525 [Alkaliphilus sp.]|nr:MAG: hypothetical protein COA82_11525 [Alkaliphilus sp.]